METKRTEPHTTETYTTETYTEYEYHVHRVIQFSGSEQETILRRQSQDVIIVEGSPCEVRGLRDDEIVEIPEKS